MEHSKEYIKDLTYKINGCAIYVHKELGPGLLEKVYQYCMAEEFRYKGIKFEEEKVVPFIFRGKKIENKLRCDFFVEDVIVVELKSVSELLPIFDAQIMTYMKLLQSPLGIILNFNVLNLYQQGQKTLVNEWYRKLPDS